MKHKKGKIKLTGKAVRGSDRIRKLQELAEGIHCHAINGSPFLRLEDIRVSQ